MTDQNSAISNQQSSGRRRVGFVVGGSLKTHLLARLQVPPQQVQEGAFVVIESNDWLFHGLVTDLQLGATNPRFADEQTTNRLPGELAGLLQGQTLYTNLEILPALMFTGGEERQGPLPVKTVPSHQADVFLASEGDVAEVFQGDFVLGHTREQNHPVAIDLDKLVKRSSGIFGATGTGKSFLTRLMLAGLIQHNAASVLVLDMHNEYAYNDQDENGNPVSGLRDKFPAKVRVAGLGAGATIRGKTPDFNLEIAMSDIQPGDIELLTRELNLKETTSATLDALLASFGPTQWFKAFKEMSRAKVEGDDGKRTDAPGSVAAWARENNVNEMAAEGLHNKLGKVFRLAYLAEKPAVDTVGEIVKSLEAGQHVILSFGKHESDLDYLLVSNLLTRRIRERWEQTTNELRSNNKGEPRPLVIAVEEAHKLLNREMAVQTTFSTIARELRKYYVTLLIIDQRPSQIYDEVMSQLGTRISGWLGDDDDIRAVLSGLAGREALRGMLARLQPKEEVLLLGWGVPMPLPIKSRRYDDMFWDELQGKGKRKGAKEVDEELGF
ncbi:MAG: ATP-binding protein [Anaerolineales bacterium]|nr:ATP-binding protein [Anaerolineales bacterium]MCW5855745.1 ATP-binding protein [Anaerolineales bacterium]